MANRTKTASIEERRDARRRRQKRKRTSRRAAVTILLLMAAAIGVCFTPVFHIKEIRVSGLNQVTQEEVEAAAGLSVGQNIFTFNIHDVAEKIRRIPYVEEVALRRSYPNVVTVEVREAVPVCYLQVGTSFAVVDKQGRVLEATDNREKYKLPLIPQQETASYVVGEILPLASDSSFAVLLNAAVAVNVNQFSDRVTDIYYEDKNIRMKLSDTLFVNLGTGDKLSAKMNMLKAVLEELPEGSAGTLDMTNSEKIYLTTD